MISTTAPAPHPTITICLPIRNEEGDIAACLESILGMSLPAGHQFELLVLDGESSDRSREIVSEFAHRDPRVRLLTNPARIQAAAFNLALAEARGRYFIRMDGHTLYDPDYVAESVRLLDETGAGNVGGVQRAAGRSWFSRAVAAAVSSPFAAGDARYRHATTPGDTDTVYLGAWRTDTLRALGGMRETWAVNEDYELNVRLRATGGRVFLSPTIRSTYFVRGTPWRLARQYFRYGFWKVRTLLEHPRSLRWRQLVAPAFVLSLLAACWTIPTFGWLGAVHLLAYALTSLTMSVRVAARSGWDLLPLLPFVFLTIHVAWGSGFLVGWGYWPLRKR